MLPQSHRLILRTTARERYTKSRYLCTWHAAGAQAWRLLSLYVPHRPADLLAKSAPLPDGARWITVHPNGKDQPGVPVMIKESAADPGSYYVIGGAGGKLSHMKMTGIKSAEQYKADQQDKQKTKREEARAKKKRLAESGELDAKKKMDEALKAASVNNRTGWLRDKAMNMLPLLGLDKKEYEFNEKRLQSAGVEPGSTAAKMVEYHYYNGLVGDLDRKVGVLKRRMLEDEQSRAAAGVEAFSLVPGDKGAIDAAVAGIDQVDARLATMQSQLDEADNRGDIQMQAALAGEMAKTEEERHNYESLLEEIGAPTVDELTSRKLASGKGYNSQAKERAIASMVESGDLSPDTLREQVGDDRSSQILDAASEMGASPETVDLIQRELNERNQLLREAAAAAEAGDHTTAFKKWNKAEGKITKWEINAARADQYTGELAPGEYLDLIGAKVTEGQATMAAVSRACKTGATARPEELRTATADYNKLRKLVAVQKQYAAKETKLNQASGEAEGEAAKQGYKVDVASIADKFHFDDLTTDEALARADTELETARMAHWNAALLSEVEESGTLTKELDIDKTKLQRAMAQHIGVGAFAAFANAGMLGAGDVLVDRPVVDLFGPKLTANLIAAHMQRTLSPQQYQAMQEGLEAFHGATSTDTAKEAYERAQEAYETARQISFGDLQDTSDPVAMQYLNDQRRAVLESALQDLGTTIGGLRANAEMVNSLKKYKNGPPKNEALAMPIESDQQLDPLIQNLAALGLGRDDYTIQYDSESKQRSLYLNDGALGKLVKSDLTQDDIESAATAQAIKTGGHDESGWLPSGVARRSASSFDGDNPEPRKFAIDPDFLSKEGPDLETHVGDYIGSRVADGWPVDSVLRELRSGSFQGTHLSDPGEAGEEGMTDMFGETVPGKPARPARSVVADVEAAIRKHMPVLAITNKLDPKEVKRVNAEKEAQARKLAGAFRQRHGLAAEPMHSQGIDTDHPGTLEALHRSLAANPVATVAYKGQQELDTRDKHALRAYFWKQMSGETSKDSKAARTAQQAEQKPKETEPEMDMGSMFGDDIETKINDPILDASYGPDDTVEIDIGGGRKRVVNALAHQAERRAALFGETKDMTGQATGKYGDMDAGDHEFAARDSWERYMMAHGDDPDAAYASIQEHVRGKFNHEFRNNYSRLTGNALVANQVPMSTPKAHAVGLLPANKFSGQYKKMKAPLEREYANVGRGRGGKFTTGKRGEKAKANVEARDQAQGRVFGDEELESDAMNPTRLSIGERAESQIGSLINQARDRWNPKADPIDLFSVSMGDDDPKSQKFYKQQRAIKLIDHQGKVGLWLGAGSGKSLTTIGAYTHLNAQGKARRALMAVPSVVQKQFGGEGLRYLDPTADRGNGRKGYKWHAEAGASAAERYKAYKDGSTDFMVLTHQAIARDTLAAIADHRKMQANKEDDDDASWEESEVSDWFSKLPREERARVAHEAFQHAGWHGFDMLYVDEAHYIANRQGKKNSTMANVMDAIGDNLKYHVLGSGTPIKNDASEAFDMLSKLDSKRFSDRSAFMRQYGGNTAASKVALQRLTSRYFYQDRVESGVEANTIVGDGGKPLKLSDAQRKAYDGVQTAYNKLKIAREDAKQSGKPIDESILLDSMKILSPNSFKGIPEDQHLAKATDLLSASGTIKDAAFNRVINAGRFEDNAKMQHVAKLAAEYKKQGKPGVVFARNLETVAELERGLKAAGHRVTVLTGGKTGTEKDAARRAFAPESKRDEDATADIIIMSDAGNTGLNLQRGKWLAHIDQPYTSPVKEQRDARINRLGQTDDVTIHELVTDTPFDGKAQRRLQRKAITSHVFQDPSHHLDDSGLAAYVNSAYRRLTGHGRMVAQAAGQPKKPAKKRRAPAAAQQERMSHGQAQ